MSNQSVWQGTSHGAVFPALTEHLEADAVIIGGGITGMMTALKLSAAGKKVVVLEAKRVGQGTTGCSTGNLHVMPDRGLHAISHKWGKKIAAAVVESRGVMLDDIEAVVARYQLSCSFARRAHYLFADDKQAHQLERERDAATEAGLSAAMVTESPVPFSTGQVLKIEQQAQFHPLNFVRELAEKINSERCRIFEHSKVTGIDDGQMLVTTAQGTVHAGKIIMATHTPKGFNVLQTELGPYREYGLAARINNGRYPDAICWSMEDPSHSIRSFEIDGRKYLIVIGEEHKTGQQETGVDYFQRVEDYTRSHFKVEAVEYRWSAQNYQPSDGLPYIGKSLASESVYVATGFGTSGLLYGPLAAAIISDDLLGVENRWAKLYRARRFSPLKSGATFIEENLNVATQYVKDYVIPARSEKLQDLKPGEGMVVTVEGEKTAVYLDENNRLKGVVPTCTHLGCIVHWNRLEKSWDCPCHGSRFDAEGEVIEGPAFSGLEKRRSA
ncbi:MAG: FAD-dependent oxidoreductase [Verrucomicrobia bacterium]|nr:FAD-dependent oxidoreductase [Deltaproteobacteria bacterium]